MKLDIFASSSEGNFYLLTGVTERIIIDPGLTIDKIKKHLGYDFSNISACLLSHEHADHSKSAKDIIDLGIRVYSSPGTFERLGIKNYYASPVKDSSVFETEEFKIKAFATEHDCEEPLGFLIFSKFEYKQIVFATDTYFLQYRFHDINTFMLEINFIQGILDHSVKVGNMPEAGAKRIQKSHFSLERAIKFLEASDLSSTERIIPIHTSKRHGDPKEIKRILEAKFNIPVIINQKRIIM